MPVAVARRLRLPLVDRLLLESFGGAQRRVPVHAALVRFAGYRCLTRVIAFDGEAIIGRDRAVIESTVGREPLRLHHLA